MAITNSGSAGRFFTLVSAVTSTLENVFDEEATDDSYIPVEEVARRLGLPLPILMGRVEAGDIPSTREETADGIRYKLRLSDLGIDIESREGLNVDYGDEEGDGPVIEMEGHRAPQAFGGEAGVDFETITVSEPEPQHDFVTNSEDDFVVPSDTEFADSPDTEFNTGVERETPVALETMEAVELSGVSYEPISEEDELTPTRVSVSTPEGNLVFDAVQLHGEKPTEIEMVPVKTAPRNEVASMSLDARELVSGLLDRWEKTLEQSIYAEQRRRFEGELIARQNTVKELQMELQTVRAEHAAIQAENARQLAEKSNALNDRERDVKERDREIEELKALLPKRRGWFHFR